MAQTVMEKILLPLIIIVIPIIEIIGKKFINWCHSKTARGKKQAEEKEAARKKELEDALEEVAKKLTIQKSELENKMANAYQTCVLGERQEQEFKLIHEDLELLKDGLQGLLRAELRLQYSNYRARGFATPEVKTDVDHLYQIYHSLGPNGVMDRAHEVFMSLPDEIPEEFKRRASDRQSEPKKRASRAKKEKEG